MKLLPQERSAVIDYIYSISAIALDSSKDYLIESRLSEVADKYACRSFVELVERARTDASRAVQRAVIDAITTGETLFFRDSAPFELLRHKLIPELIDRQNKSLRRGPLRIWSAACSTGQELYSVAMLLREMVGDPARYNFRLVGTDLSDEAVARASAGYFNSIEITRGLTAEQRSRNFLETEKGWRIRDEVRSLVSFRRLNLMEDFAGMGKFDVILCRNVAIYFHERDRVRLFQRLAKQLEPQGALIIGSMESLGNMVPGMESKRYLRAVYYQWAAGQ